MTMYVDKPYWLPNHSLMVMLDHNFSVTQFVSVLSAYYWPYHRCEKPSDHGRQALPSIGNRCVGLIAFAFAITFQIQTKYQIQKHAL